MDCKLVGPETLCFCTHRYKQHKTDYEEIPKNRPICVPCRVSRCQCKSYHYVPLNGTQPIRCRCKHFADQHSAAPGFSCNSCSKCSGFHSCFTCGCGQPTYAHETVVETKQERLAQGKPVGQDVPYAAMGGLTGFSSLAEGYMRLDDSGVGSAVNIYTPKIHTPSQLFKIMFNVPMHHTPASAVDQLLASEAMCQVLYIDYGNSEILNRSEIVEIPKNLQFPSIAKKYRLWGLQIPPDQDLNQFDQGRKFLCSLIFEKEIKMRHKATYQDGTIVAQAEYGKVDIGEEVAKKGFAEKCKSPINANNCEEKKIDVVPYKPWNAKVTAPAWENRPNPSVSNRLKGRFGDQIGTNTRNENHTGNHMPFAKEKLLACDFIMGSNISLAKIKQDQKLIEENEKLKKEKEILQEENHILLHNYKELESTIAQLNHQVQSDESGAGPSADTWKPLWHQRSDCFIDVGGFPSYEGPTFSPSPPPTLLGHPPAPISRRRKEQGVLGSFLASTRSKQGSQGPNHLQSAIGPQTGHRHSTVAEFVPLRCGLRERTLLLNLKGNRRPSSSFLFAYLLFFFVVAYPVQELSASLGAVYGQASEADDSEEAFQQFFEWKQTKLEEFSRVRSGTNASLQILATWFSGMIKHSVLFPLKFFDLTSEVSLKSEEVVGNVDEVLEKVESDICKELEISLVSDDYSEYEITKIKEEITGLRNRLIQEIYNEQEEYNSGGLLTVSLERDLLDAEPLKKLSTKHPLVCSEVQEQKVLLKGYSVDVNTEAKVIERTAKYHRAWSEFKEKSGLLQLMFLFLCKEILKVMEGVARGLHTLHKANIVHGSLHTNNVFALNRKQGIVGDFDFTKSVDQRASANSMVVGNLNLISPELRMGHLASPSSDMYAYGCLLFWLCVGDQEFKIKENGTPEVDGLNMDNKFKSLLLNLICSNRMTAEQVLNDECFLFPDVIPAPPQNEPGEELECEKTEEKGEDIISSDNKTDDNEEIDPSQ
ncbi:Serine/threonine-protein kinase 31 [Chelonia mydas]|uniref:Protein FAM221A n=1 Tax=Chelonia mydas TaxID=8469 RepID=M7C2Y2_CHEMY|nr:Serine/threonine-protein kinase 31 [Chelonia mydas]